MSFGEWVLWLIYFFFMIIYFMMIFKIIMDVFRRDDLGGWGKAGWMVILLFIPLLTMLIYIITQGRQMASRDMSQMSRLRSEQDAYIRSAASGGSTTADQIAQAHKLLQDGAITPAEFDSLKTKALAG